MVEFHLQKIIDQPLKSVFNSLAEVDQFVDHHPLIYRAKKIGPHKYLMYERTPWKMWPLHFSYPATIQSDARAHTVIMDATVYKITRLHFSFQLTAEGEQTMLRETVRIEGMRWIAQRLKNIIIEAHEVLFENLGRA